MLLNLDDTSIYYEILGEGIPVLMIHGFASDHRFMVGACEPSFDKPINVKRIYFDLPGMGKSPAMDWIQSADDLVKVILNFIDKIIPNTKFGICAHSYGAYLARAILKERSDRIIGAFLFCPVIQPIHKLRNRPKLKILKHDPSLLATLSPYELKKYTSMTVLQSQDTWDRYKEEFLPGIQIYDRELYKRVMQNYALMDNPDQIEHPYSFPTVVLMGRQDSVAGYKDHWTILENFLRASFLIIDGAGHNLHAEKPIIFNFHLAEWIQTLENFLF
jgi:pimeloyl-ACP methyl ester carboxylesterase